PVFQLIRKQGLSYIQFLCFAFMLLLYPARWTILSINRTSLNLSHAVFLKLHGYRNQPVDYFRCQPFFRRGLPLTVQPLWHLVCLLTPDLGLSVNRLAECIRERSPSFPARMFP